MDVTSWSAETRGAYLACALETDGWVSLRETRRTDGTRRLTANVGVTNTCRELLERIAVLADVPLNITLNGKAGRDSRGIVTRGDVWQVYWRSPLHVVQLLEPALPFMLGKAERAAAVLEFARSRISPAGEVFRSGRPYTDRDWALATAVTAANGRSRRDTAA